MDLSIPDDSSTWRHRIPEIIEQIDEVIAGWEARLTQVIAVQVRRRRVRAGLSTQKLADITAKIGHPIPRSVLANLENGRREFISITELLVLAKAFDMPVLGLIFPVGDIEQVEALPGSRWKPKPPPKCLPAKALKHSTSKHGK